MPKVNVFITVDTEHSIGGAFNDPKFAPVGNDRRIFYETKNGAFGIPLIMDIAERYGLKVSFFLEVLNKYYFGESESEKACQYILKRGHDVQLHLHPNFLNFITPKPEKRQYLDHMHCYSLEKQIEMIKDGKETLIRCGIPAPKAFRAGNFGADRNTLLALKANSFLVDSSYNRAYLNSACKLGEMNICDAAFVAGIWEFPVTNFIERFGWSTRYRPLDINGVSFRQIKNVLLSAADHKIRNVTIVMHSFSFINPLDVQYKKIKPRLVVIRRFENLCRFLAQHTSVFQVVDYRGLNEEALNNPNRAGYQHMPELGSMLSIERHFEQMIDQLPLGHIISFDH